MLQVMSSKEVVSTYEEDENMQQDEAAGFHVPFHFLYCYLQYEQPRLHPTISAQHHRLHPPSTAACDSDAISLQNDREKMLPPKAAPITTSLDNLFQVVVMRVSIHCQGCAGKLKKHLSKMEGVTSFSIDLESKRVTVMGHVSPSGVLESISKVKKAEFWPR